MIIASLSENKSMEKRISITPEIAKKYSSMGFKINITKNYGLHLGFNDEEFKEVGVDIYQNDKEVISNADIIVQLNFPSDEIISLIKPNQTLIGVFNPYENQNKLKEIVNKNVNVFSLELLPRITRAQSMDILSSQANLAGYKAVIESFATFEKAIPMMMTAAGTVPAAVIIIGTAFSNSATQSTTALYPAKLD